MTIAKPISGLIGYLEHGPALERAYALAPLPARVLMAAIFLWSGFGKVMDPGMTMGFMTMHHMPMVPVFLALSIMFELGGGIALLLGYHGRLAAGALILFMIPTTLIFHNFWTYTGQDHMMQLINFMKNTSIIGGLLMVVGLGAGGYSLDHLLAKK